MAQRKAVCLGGTAFWAEGPLGPREQPHDLCLRQVTDLSGRGSHDRVLRGGSLVVLPMDAGGVCVRRKRSAFPAKKICRWTFGGRFAGRYFRRISSTCLCT